MVISVPLSVCVCVHVLVHVAVTSCKYLQGMDPQGLSETVDRTSLGDALLAQWPSHLRG